MKAMTWYKFKVLCNKQLKKRKRRKFLFITRCKTHIKYMRKQRKTSRFCYINNILPCLVQRTCQFYSKSKKQNDFVQNVNFTFNSIQQSFFLFLKSEMKHLNQNFRLNSLLHHSCMIKFIE